GERVEAALRTARGQSIPPLLPRVEGIGEPPLSFAQQRLWFIDQLEPGSPLYNMAMVLRVAGPLDGALLARCLGEIVRRHETLRTVFPLRDETPVQVIQPASTFVLPLIDLSGLPGLSDRSDRSDRSDSRAARQARLLAVEEAARPFDLAQGPLLRGFLLRLAPPGEHNDHLLALNIHHIVSDGWSSGILIHEIQALYAAFAAGRPSPLPELPLQYADFAAWQRSWLQGEVLESEVSFWRRQLAGLPPYLELPTDRPRPAIRSFRGGVLPFQLPAGLTRQAQALGRREEATLFMVLLAGFQVLLARYSGQPVLAVGTPTAGRNRVEIEGLIGFFVNTLVLRGDLTADLSADLSDIAAGALSFRELLGRVRTTVLTAHEHQDVPFEKLVQELTPERSLTHTPLFQVMMTLQNFPSEGFALAGLSIAPVLQEAASEKFDLELTFTEEGGGLTARLDYAGDLFDASTIRRMAGQLIALLEGAQAGPDRRLQDLPLLSAGERHQLETEWNDTAVPSSTRSPGVLALFAAQVRRSPEALAVVAAGDAGEGLTYRELDRRADRLAGRLRAAGVRPEMPVGLCVEHTPELVVGILGILKSGGAWLPLDPAHPRARLELLLEDAAVPVLVTQSHLLESLPSHGVQTVLLRGEEAEGEDGEDGGDGELPASGHLAYLIYTSGTTGRPKAVQVEHGMLAATLAATQSRFRFGADDRMPCLALSTFDIVLFELLSPLLAGGTAVLFPRRPTPDIELLVDRLGELTCLHAVPALMREIVEAVRRRGAGAPDVTKMRAVFVGGDAVPAGLLEDLRAAFPAAQAWVLYGPTEGTIVCAAWPLPPLPPRPAPARSLLGRPLPGAVLHVCDGYGDLLPPGIPGELWIGGPGVTRGYLGRRELTADKYVPSSGGRLYRSGDRVRRLADGTLEFLGRLDHQVKVRGVRIEPGEIEAALAGLPGVREAVVVARAASDRSDRSVGSSDDRRLVAYVVGDATAGELRQGLRERLPDSMVPALFVTLPVLPRSPNGKVDRAALPAPDAAWPDAAREHVAPRTREEEILATIWAQVLGL
ncbi:MAG TPA: amino acid adenylation domain-containing protein, partial [Thermoanaerobaculia bacterium]